jgi:nucleoside-diphosphate-sugar epimerase
VAVTDPVAPNDEYARSKAAAEAELLGSGLNGCVLRLAAVMPSGRPGSLRQAAAAFDLPLNARCEAVLDLDVAAACIEAAEKLVLESGQGEAAAEVCDRIGGSVFFIGGGSAGGWQIDVREMYRTIFEPIGVRLPAEHLFVSEADRFAIDWYDTDDAQRHLHYQNHSRSEYEQYLARKYRVARPLVSLARPLVTRIFERMSPYGAAQRSV